MGVLALTKPLDPHKMLRVANLYTTTHKRTDELAGSDVVYLGLDSGFYRITEIKVMHGGSMYYVGLQHLDNGKTASLANNAETLVEVRN